MHRNDPIGQQNPSIPRQKETPGNQVHMGEIREPKNQPTRFEKVPTLQQSDYLVTKSSDQFFFLSPNIYLR